MEIYVKQILSFSYQSTELEKKKRRKNEKNKCFRQYQKTISFCVFNLPSQSPHVDIQKSETNL